MSSCRILFLVSSLGFLSGCVASFLPLSQSCTSPSLKTQQQELVHGSRFSVTVGHTSYAADPWDRHLGHFGKFTQEVSVRCSWIKPGLGLPSPVSGAYPLYMASLRTGRASHSNDSSLNSQKVSPKPLQTVGLTQTGKRLLHFLAKKVFNLSCYVPCYFFCLWTQLSVWNIIDTWGILFD